MASPSGNNNRISFRFKKGSKFRINCIFGTLTGIVHTYSCLLRQGPANLAYPRSQERDLYPSLAFVNVMACRAYMQRFCWALASCVPPKKNTLHNIVGRLSQAVQSPMGWFAQKQRENIRGRWIGGSFAISRTGVKAPAAAGADVEAVLLAPAPSTPADVQKGV